MVSYFNIPPGTTSGTVASALAASGSRASVASLNDQGLLGLNGSDAAAQYAVNAMNGITSSAPGIPAAPAAPAAPGSDSTTLILGGIAVAGLAFMFLRGSRPAMRPAFGAVRRNNNPGYKFYVVKNGKIQSGWEYREDAADHAREIGAGAKVTPKSRAPEVNDNSNWGTGLDGLGVSKIKKSGAEQGYRGHHGFMPAGKPYIVRGYYQTYEHDFSLCKEEGAESVGAALAQAKQIQARCHGTVTIHARRGKKWETIKRIPGVD